METKSNVTHGRAVGPLAGTAFAELDDIGNRLLSLANRAERLHESAFGRPPLAEMKTELDTEESPMGVIGHVGDDIAAVNRAAARIEAALANFETAFGASK